MAAPTPKEIRTCYSEYRNETQDIRDQAELDMQCLSITGPWSDTDRSQREDAGRPCIHLDQTNQYVHQYCGNLRKNKRAVQVTPKGNGANEGTAAKRSNLIRSIEEQSNAATAVYTPAAESAAMRSYGFSVIRTDYKPGKTFDQELLIKPVPNPDCVLLNPYYKQPNACDIEDAFLLDIVTKKKFKALYPKARLTSFEGEEVTGVGISEWIKENYVVRGEYWKIHQKTRTLLLVRRGDGPLEVAWEDEVGRRFKNGEFAKKGISVAREREVSTPYVKQYMTNGIEILDEVDWPGKRIPIISCLGPERWRISGGKPIRELISLTRFARDPQMLFDFLATQECEEAGMVPKVPFVGAKGQFESDYDTWEDLNHSPHAFVQYDPITDATGDNLIPAPQRPQYVANFQQYEMAKDSAGRSLQASMGISPLPTAAQRSNQKSGLALEKIQNEEDIGTYQFIDNFENGYLHNMGWQLNDLLGPILDTDQEVPISEPDGTHKTLRLVGRTSHPMQNGAYELQDADGNQLPEEHLHTDQGDHGVTISSGPSFQSEREAQADFVDTITANLANLPQPGTPQAKVFALAVRMRPDLGAIGKQIADVFDPPDNSGFPPAAQAAIQNLQGQMQQLQQENIALHMERAGKVLELQNKYNIESMKGTHKLDEKTMELVIKIVTAELAKQSKADDNQARADADQALATLGFNESHIDRAHDAAHEAGMQAVQHAHERSQTAAQAEIAAQQAETAQEEQPQPGSEG